MRNIIQTKNKLCKYYFLAGLMSQLFFLSYRFHQGFYEDSEFVQKQREIRAIAGNTGHSQREVPVSLICTVHLSLIHTEPSFAIATFIRLTAD